VPTLLHGHYRLLNMLYLEMHQYVTAVADPGFDLGGRGASLADPGARPP